MKFESPIEELMYPILKEIADSYDMQLEYQEKVFETDECDWVSDRMSEGAEYSDLLEWANENEVPMEYSYEKYRIDFVLRGHKEVIAIEIDGKQFHTDDTYEFKRDQFLRKMGYTEVLHFSSDDVLPFKKRKIISHIIALRLMLLPGVRNHVRDVLCKKWVETWLTKKP